MCTPDIHEYGSVSTMSVSFYIHVDFFGDVYLVAMYTSDMYEYLLFHICQSLFTYTYILL